MIRQLFLNFTFQLRKPLLCYPAEPECCQSICHSSAFINGMMNLLCVVVLFFSKFPSGFSCGELFQKRLFFWGASLTMYVGLHVSIVILRGFDNSASLSSFWGLAYRRFDGYYFHDFGQVRPFWVLLMFGNLFRPFPPFSSCGNLWQQ